MPAALSSDLRRRVVETRAREGLDYRGLAERFQISESTVSRLLRRQRETGSIEPLPHGGGTPFLVSPAKLSVLKGLVAQQPDATLKELCTKFCRRTRVKLSHATMCRELRRMGLTRKKSPSSPRNGNAQRFTRAARLSFMRCAAASLNG